MAAALSQRMSLRAPARSPVAARPYRPSRAIRMAPRAALPAPLVVSASTAILLAIGRFAFLPFHRRSLSTADSVGSKTKGDTYFDKLQQEATFVTNTNDPAGFTLIDVLGWGALGHALGFFILATSSLPQSPFPFK